MPGKKITNQQVKIYMTARRTGHTQIAAAAKAAFSERSGRSAETGKLQPGSKHPRDWRTREDPFSEVWDDLLVPQLEASPALSAITLLEWLQEKYPDQYPDEKLRTLQRRVKAWKAQNGPEKELIIRQNHEPGCLALSDFTQLKKVVITIKGVPFDHLLYHFRLAYSRWSFMQVVEGGESYSALTEGMQNALWQLGGVPQEHRTDHLSAAARQEGSRERLTARYSAFCDHYGIQATFNNLGQSHENGAVEGPHGHIKRRIRQALLLRASNDFNSVEEYADFIRKIVAQHNRRNAKTIDIERPALQPLPTYKACDYDRLTTKVSSSGTIQIRHVTYSLPSRLRGERLHIHLYDNRLEAYLGTALVYQCKRVRPKKKNVRARHIELSHVIETLKRKPGAFRGCQYREDLFPNEDYRQIWQFIEGSLTKKAASKYMIGLLDLSLKVPCHIELGEYLLEKLTTPQKAAGLPSLVDVEKRFVNASTDHTDHALKLDVKQHDLSDYDAFLTIEGNKQEGQPYGERG